MLDLLTVGSVGKVRGVCRPAVFLAEAGLSQGPLQPLQYLLKIGPGLRPWWALS